MGFMVCRKSALILTLKDVNWVYLCRPKFKSHFNKILSFTPRPEKLLHVFLSLFLWAFFFIPPKLFDESVDLYWSLYIMKGLILERIPVSCHFWSHISKYYYHCLVLQEHDIYAAAYSCLACSVFDVHSCSPVMAAWWYNINEYLHLLLRYKVIKFSH